MHSKASELLWPLSLRSTTSNLLLTASWLPHIPPTHPLGRVTWHQIPWNLRSKFWDSATQKMEQQHIRQPNCVSQTWYISVHTPRGDTKNLTISNIGLNVALFAQKCALAVNWKLSPSEICAAPWPNGSCAWLHSLLLCDSAAWLCAGQPAGPWVFATHLSRLPGR